MAKKIIFVIPHMYRGGAERVVSHLANYFHATGIEVSVVRFYGLTEYDLFCESINLNLPNTFKFSSIINIFKRTIKLRAIFNNKKPDLIISFIGNLQSILTGYPVVASIRIDIDHGDEFINKPFFHFQLRTIYKFVNVLKVVTVSKAIESKLRTRFGITKTRTIYNPIDFELIDRQSQETVPFDFPYIVAVGSFKHQNGFDLLIEAFHGSNLRGKKSLVIVGDGNLRPELESQIEKLGLSNEVILAGKTSNPYSYMRKADFFVLSSRFEGFPNVLVEALACGKPCIATNCETGPREIITHMQNGLLIDVGSVPALRNAINLLSEDINLKERLASVARQSVEYLAIENIAAEWLTLIKK